MLPRPLQEPVELQHPQPLNEQRVLIPVRLLQEELLHLLNSWQAPAQLHLLRESVEPERRHLRSEQQAALPHRYNAVDTQLALLYSVQEVRVRRCDQAVALVAHHLQALVLLDKGIPAQHGLEHALALLCSVLHSDRKNDVRP